MKAVLFLVAITFGLALQTHSQCTIVATVAQVNNGACVGAPIEYFGYASANCPNATSYTYIWQANVIDGGGEIILPEEYMATGSISSPTLIPNFQYIGQEPLFQTCLTVIAYDNLGSPIGTGSYCSTTPFIGNPIIPIATVQNNQCGDQACVVVQTSGGSAPYQYLVNDGSTLSGNGYACFDVPGIYQVTATDANGCVGYADFEITISDSQNNSCENAQLLENSIVIQDTLCGLEFAIPTCSNMTYYQSGWYVINSSDFTHLQVAAYSGYSPGTISQNMAIEILASTTDCTSAEQVYCTTNTSCFDLADNITIQPNTNYYIHLMTQWTSNVPASIVAVLGTEPQAGICGCTNPLSCNYDPEALVDDGSCGYNGCTDPGACNYVYYASCDDGSCYFGNDLTGHIYHDVNGDGVYSTWPIIEPSIGTVGYILVEELNIVIYPNSDGEFVIPELPTAQYHVSYVDPTNTWEMASGASLTVTLPTCVGLNIPLVPVSGATAQISGAGTFWSSIFQCTNGITLGVWVQNTGTTSFSGNFTITFDPSLSVSNIANSIPFTSAAAGSASWEIVDQAPGTTQYYLLHVAGPGVNFVGQYFDFGYSLTLVDNADLAFYSNEWTTSNLVSCSYDPNDKQAIPAGYAEPHFILADTEIEYKIRFQNTGNAPAFNVHIEDQLDISKLDLITFYPVVASHSYSTLVQPDGHITFSFDNIMLPDSASDEAGSQGYVIYRIKPLSNITSGSVIENTGYIYFDENPAIVTNTTFHTIYDCSQMPELTDSFEICEETEQIVGWDYQYIETSQWTVNSDLASEEINFLLPNTIGSYFIQNTISNPLCSATSDYYINVNPLPEATITLTDGLLVASSGSYYQWYIFNQPISGGNSQTQEVYATGPYTVTVINEFGCLATSESFQAVGIDESSVGAISLYPNPVQNNLTLTVPNTMIGSLFNIIDATGKLVNTGQINSLTHQIAIENLTAGVYHISIYNANDISSATFIKIE